MSLQHIPEFTHRCVNSSFICLVRRDRTMDHAARFAIHKEANVCTCWRFPIRVLWKHCCLHISLLKFHLLLFLKYQFNTFKGQGKRNTDSRREDGSTQLLWTKKMANG